MFATVIAAAWWVGGLLVQAVPNAVGGVLAYAAHRLIWRKDRGGPTP